MKAYSKFLSLLSCALTIAMPAMANNCDNEIYRRYNPDRCATETHTDRKFSFASAATITGGVAALIGGTVAVLGLTSSDGHTSSQPVTTNQTIPTIPAHYNNMVGADVDLSALETQFNDTEYIRNGNQYNDIRVAYSLARGFTGAGSNIAVFDFGKNTWHGGNVTYLSSGLIAPNASVTSYQVADISGRFYSFSEIGDTINSATNSNANIYNFSWEITNISANQITSRQHMINTTSRGFIDSLITASQQNDAIFVWAAGNGRNSESNALAALPLHVNELAGHFVNVVAWDSQTQSLAEFSNECGITQNYCITAPGVALDTPKTDRPLDGTSFAAPIVSAAIAVIREAFPYMQSAEITNLLFTTARDLGDAGIDRVYGHGMLDLERATRPVGTALVPLSESNTVALRTAHVVGSVGHKIKSANIKFSFVDSFGRAFDTKLNDNIRVKNRGIAYDHLTVDNAPGIQIGNIEFGFKQSNLFQGTGFLSTENQTLTSFIGFKNDINIGNLNLFHDTQIGFTHPTASDESMISGFSNITTAAIKIGANYKDFSLSIGTPETIISGNMYLNTPNGRRNNGEYIFTRQTIALDDTPSFEISASYKFLTAGFVDNPYGTDEIYAIARGKIIF